MIRKNAVKSLGRVADSSSRSWGLVSSISHLSSLLHIAQQFHCQRCMPQCQRCTAKMVCKLLKRFTALARLQPSQENVPIHSLSGLCNFSTKVYFIPFCGFRISILRELKLKRPSPPKGYGHSLASCFPGPSQGYAFVQPHGSW